MYSVLLLGYSVTIRTTDFDSVGLGLTPSTPAKISRLSTVDSTRRYERWDTGSIPVGGSK